MSRKRSKTHAQGTARQAPPAGPIRLQRVLAQSGFGSRRECEQLILEGRVEIDGQVANELGVRADPRQQVVRVDGMVVKLEGHQYFAVNKPPGVLSTCRDPSGRLRVIDLIPSKQRVYNVGRLDKSSEGLILVTNDGDLANRLTHPRYGVDKTYLVTVAGRPTLENMKALRRGIHLAEGHARVNSIRIKRSHKTTSDLLIVLDEGRNREIRRLLAQIGHKVLRLKRIAIGPLRLGDLPTGAHRQLERSEVTSLRRATSLKTPASGRVTRKRALEKSRPVKPAGSGSTTRTSARSTANAAPKKRSSKSGGARSRTKTNPSTRGDDRRSRSTSRQQPAAKAKSTRKKRRS